MNPANGHYYELVADLYITWSAARDAASGMTLDGNLCNGYLATVTSQEENDFIVATFGKEVPSSQMDWRFPGCTIQCYGERWMAMDNRGALELYKLESFRTE